MHTQLSSSKLTRSCSADSFSGLMAFSLETQSTPISNQEAALRARLQELEETNYRLVAEAQHMQRIADRRKTRNMLLKQEKRDLFSEVNALKQELEGRCMIGSGEALDHFAGSLLDSIVLLQSMSEPPPPPPPPPLPPLPSMLLNFSGGSNPIAPLLDIPLIDYISIQAGNLKTHTREFVWRIEPSDSQKGDINWLISMNKLVTEAIFVLKGRQQLIQQLKEDDSVITKEEVVERMATMRTQFPTSSDEEDWPDVDDEWDDDSPSQYAAQENAMLASMCAPEKFRNTFTKIAMIERLELLASEKKKQLERTLGYLAKLLKSLMDAKNLSAIIKREAEKEYARQEEIRRREEAEAVAKRVTDHVEATKIARDLLWSCLGESEKGRLKFGNSIKQDDESKTVKEVARFCRSDFVGIYLQRLKIHPKYESLLQQFHEELEDGFI